MKKSLIALALVSAFAANAFAEEAAPAAPAGPHTFTGNMTIASDYRFRGISQTLKKPAIQGGVDYSHESGVYLGNWNSNVAEQTGYPGGNIEMDFYGGWKKSFGDFGLDVGGLYYYYPGSDASLLGANNLKKPGKVDNGVVHNGELYIAGSWKFISLKYSHAVTDYFSNPGTKGTGYWDLSANYDLGDGWGVNGHFGYTAMKNFDYAFSTRKNDGKYSDWKIGVTKDFSGWVVGASYVGTDAKDNSSTADFYSYVRANGKTIAAGSDTLVLSVSKTF